MSKIKNTKALYLDNMESPLGYLWIRATERGIASITLSDQAPETYNPNAHTALAIQELEGYFKGTLHAFTVSLDAEGTAFQQKVWEQLKTIPYGTATTYKNIAHQLGNPLTIRAVGNANGKNPIPIIVPCHRVIGSGGKLVGYALGLDVKEWLLNHENSARFPRQLLLDIA